MAHQRTTRASLLASSNLASGLVRADSEDEDKEKEDAAKADADAASTLDKTLSHLADSMSAINQRLDSMESERKDKKDSAKADAERCDEDKEKDKEKSDAEGEDKEKGEAERLAADKGKKDSARKDGDDENKDDKPAFLKGDKKDSMKKDEDKEEGEKADSVTISRADLQAMREQMNTSAQLIKDMAQHIPRQRNDDDTTAFSDAQARADSVYHQFGRAAPGPMNGEDLTAYNIRLARGLASHSDTYKDMNLRAIGEPKMLDVAIAGIYADALKSANNPDAGGANELRVVTRHSGGHEFREYHGDSRSWMYPMAGPVRQFVTGFND